jgi:hypothetical protein
MQERDTGARDLATPDELVEQATRARQAGERTAGTAAGAHQQAAGARERAALAERR